VGSLNWLAHTTKPDISTAVSLLAQHQSEPSTGHLEAAKYVTKYLASTKMLGIYITSHRQSILESFLHFSLPPNIMSMSNANWGPQDASLSNSEQELCIEIHVCIYIDLLGPLHWISKCQKATAASSAESKIYATN